MHPSTCTSPKCRVIVSLIWKSTWHFAGCQPSKARLSGSSVHLVPSTKCLIDFKWIWSSLGEIPTLQCLSQQCCDYPQVLFWREWKDVETIFGFALDFLNEITPQMMPWEQDQLCGASGLDSLGLQLLPRQESVRTLRYSPASLLGSSVIS